MIDHWRCFSAPRFLSHVPHFVGFSLSNISKVSKLSSFLSYSTSRKTFSLRAFSNMNTEKKINVLVYADEGTGEISVHHALNSLKIHLGENYAIQKVYANQIINDPWEETTNLFVMPGGRDIPYFNRLKGKGNEKIRKYVENGGKYLGLCAGGYYASSKIEFEVGTENEVKGDREICFFPGLARGSVFPYFDYSTSKGAHAASILFEGETQPIPIYFNGGCEFICSSEEFPQIKVLGKYEKTNTPAIVECSIKLGKAILTGIHPEFIPSSLNSSDEDLKNILPSLLLHDSRRVILFRSLLKNLGMELTENPQEIIPPLSKNYLFCSSEYQLDQMKTILSPLAEKLSLDYNLSTKQADISFDCETFSKLLKTNQLGRTFLFGEIVTSTQTILVDNPIIFQQIPGLVYICSRQLQGVGRGNNTWVSPFGCLMFSIQLLHKDASNILFLQYVMAIAIVDCIRSLSNYKDLDLKIKWPNDLYSNKKKIGGILVNSSYMNGVFGIVIGVGLNTWNANPSHCINKIIELYNQQYQANLPYISREEMLALILNKFEELYNDFSIHGFSNLEDKYYKYWLHSNEKVQLETEGTSREVRLTGLTSSGFLRAVDVRTNQEYELHPDGNHFDLLKGLIQAKL